MFPQYPSAIYVGIGVGSYDYEYYKPLPNAVSEVRDIRDWFASHHYQTHVVEDPSSSTLNPTLGNFLSKDVLLRGGSLVILWTGHGEPTANQNNLHLIVRDTAPQSGALITAQYLADVAARTGANQILLLFDTCYSGHGVLSAIDIADHVLVQFPPNTEQVWIGVVASAMDFERARDGIFGSRLLQLLKNGPTNPELRFRWSAHNAGIRGDDLIDAIVKEWNIVGQRPKPAMLGNAWVMFPNPHYDPDAPECVTEHLLLAARGGEREEQESYFTGRVVQINRIVKWLHAQQPGVFVVTGPAGSGKSAIVGRIVSLSNSMERARILALGSIEHDDPNEGSIHVHVHARGMNAERLAEAIDQQLIRCGLLPCNPLGARNRGELLGAIQRFAVRPVILLDGLDEAGAEEASNIVKKLVRFLAEASLLLVSTRDLPTNEMGLTLVQSLGAGFAIDLGEQALQSQTEAEVKLYIEKRLHDISASMEPAKIGETVVRLIQKQQEGLFLFAQIITTQLRTAPIDTSLGGWDNLLDQNIEAALDRNLSQAEPLARGEQVLPQAAREMLTALAWGQGQGMPDDIWPIVATALSPTKTAYSRSDVFWAISQIGRYVVESGHGGVAVYRLGHQRLTKCLREDIKVTLGQENTPALQVALALVRYYLSLLSSGQSPEAHPYLLENIWLHCALAGESGIEALRQLVDLNESAFRPSLALALYNLGNWGYYAGGTVKALAAAEESVNFYRAMADADLAHLPDLVDALQNLRNCHRDLGNRQDAFVAAQETVAISRRLAAINSAFRVNLADAIHQFGLWCVLNDFFQEAIASLEEAVSLYRELAASNPALRHLLAMALTNLGSVVEEQRDALTAEDEALALYRELAATNSAYLPKLADALYNASNHPLTVGRKQNALDLPLEAVTLYQKVAATDAALKPGLADALNNLFACYISLNNWPEACAAAEEAVNICRELDTANPFFRIRLANNLYNLALCYSNVGRFQKSLDSIQEAVAIRRELRTSTPQLSGGLANISTTQGICFDFKNRQWLEPNQLTKSLATSLDTLAKFYGRLHGRWQDALAPLSEVLELYRDLVTSDLTFWPSLIDALNELALCYENLGEQQKALDSAKETVAILRLLSTSDSAYRSELAETLHKLGTAYRRLGQHQQALTYTEEAASFYRKLAADTPAYRPTLAITLNHLGICYDNLGRLRESLAAAKEAANITRDLTVSNPRALPLLADMLNNISMLNSRLGHRQAELDAIKEVVNIYRKLAAADLKYQSKFADALYTMHYSHMDLEQWKEALADITEAIRLYRTLAITEQQYRPVLANALFGLGRHHGFLGNKEKAVACTEEAISICRDLASADLKYRPILAAYLHNLGVFCSALSRWDDARKALSESVELFRQSPADAPYADVLPETLELLQAIKE